MPTLTDSQTLNHAATTISYTLLQELYQSAHTPLSQHLNPTIETAVLAKLQHFAQQYLLYDLPFYATTYYTLEAAKTCAELKPFFRMGKQQQSTLLAQLKNSLTQKEVTAPPPNSIHHLPRISNIEASSHRINQSIKQNLSSPNQLVSKIAGHLHTDSPQTDLPSAKKLQVAQDIVEAIKISAALNTNPDSSLENTLYAVIASLPQSSQYIRQITTDTQIVKSLSSLYLVTQEALIKTIPSGHLLTLDLNHSVTSEELSQIFSAASSLRISPLSTIIARTIPKSQLPQLSDSPLNLIYEPIALERDIAVISTPAAKINPISTNELVTSFNQVSLPTIPPSKTPPPSPALFTTASIFTPTPRPPTPPIIQPAPPTITPPKTTLLPHVLLPTPSPTPKAPPPNPSITPTPPISIKFPLSQNIISLLTLTISAPIFSVSSFLQSNLITLSNTKTKSPFFLSLIITLTSIFALLFLVVTTNLASFLQPLTDTSRNVIVNPPPRNTGFCWPVQLTGGATARITVLEKYADGNPHWVFGYYDDNIPPIFHPRGSAVDIGGDFGTLIITPFPGTVKYAGAAGGPHLANYGNWVVIDVDPPTNPNAPSGFSLIFAHLASWGVSAGDRVAANEIIGTMGRSGRADGEHLHYESVYWNDINARINISEVTPDTPPLQVGSIITEANQCPIL